MAVETLTCYVLRCDECGKPIESVEYEGGTYLPHFKTAEKTRAALGGDPDDEDDNYDALLDGQHVDGRDLCGECNAKRVCAERGHRWSEWTRCFCRGLNYERPPSRGHENGCPRWRSCDRWHCSAQETESLPSAVTA